MKYRRGIFMLVYAKEREKPQYLILRRKLHWKGWEFPKGGKEKNEDINKAIKREILEETGLKIRKITNLKVSGRFDYERELPDRPGIKGQDWKLFAVEVKKNKVRLDKREHEDYRWLDFKKALKILTWPNQRNCLKLVNKFLELVKLKEKYAGYRLFVTSSGIGVVGGKNAKQNEELMGDFKGKNVMIMHTAKPGSSFCIILGNADKKDIKESAVFCAKYSRDWKKNKGDVEIHVFNGKDVYKNRKMKTGTFGVRKLRKIFIKKEEIRRAFK